MSCHLSGRPLRLDLALWALATFDCATVGFGLYAKVPRCHMHCSGFDCRPPSSEVHDTTRATSTRSTGPTSRSLPRSPPTSTSDASAPPTSAECTAPIGHIPTPKASHVPPAQERRYTKRSPTTVPRDRLRFSWSRPVMPTRARGARVIQIATSPSFTSRRPLASH